VRTVLRSSPNPTGRSCDPQPAWQVVLVGLGYRTTTAARTVYCTLSLMPSQPGRGARAARAAHERRQGVVISRSGLPQLGGGW
jgi:hypothetical protein